MRPIINIMTKFQSPAIFMLTVFTAMAVSAASQPVLKIGEYTGCINKEIIIPVKVENMQEISAITLYIMVDTNSVEFLGLENVNSEFQSGNFIGNLSSEGNIILSWFSTSPASIDSGVICDMRLRITGDNTVFHFKNSSEFVKPDLSIVENVEYHDGLLTSVEEIQPTPETQSVVEGVVVNYSVDSFDNSNEFRWQMLRDGQWQDVNDDGTFAGCQSNRLYITVDTTLNNVQFRCNITNDSCSDFTKSCTLLVTPSFVDELGTTQSKVFPNPFNQRFFFITENDLSDGKIVVIDQKGKLVLEQENIFGNGKVNIIDFKSNEQGLFIMKVIDKVYSSEQVFKIIRN